MTNLCCIPDLCVTNSPRGLVVTRTRTVSLSPGSKPWRRSWRHGSTCWRTATCLSSSAKLLANTSGQWPMLLCGSGSNFLIRKTASKHSGPWHMLLCGIGKHQWTMVHSTVWQWKIPVDHGACYCVAVENAGGPWHMLLCGIGKHQWTMAHANCYGRSNAMDAVTWML